MQLTAQKKQHDFQKIRNSIICTDPPESYQTICQKGLSKNQNYNAKLLDLCRRLMDIGGISIVLPDFEEDIDDILKYGQLWDNITTHHMPGRPSQCHANSCDLWYNNRNAETFCVSICTGYALSEDGLWRQHSWLMQLKARANVLIETTEPRIAYFGFAMTPPQCLKFYSDNY